MRNVAPLKRLPSNALGRLSINSQVVVRRAVEGEKLRPRQKVRREKNQDAARRLRVGGDRLQSKKLPRGTKPLLPLSLDSSMKSAVYALFPSRRQAESVLDELFLAGFKSNDVSIVFRDTRSHEEHLPLAACVSEAPVRLEALTQVRSLRGNLGRLAISGSGNYLAAGPIFTLLSEALAVGGRNQSALGAVLFGLGFRTKEAEVYEDTLENGNVLIAAHTGSPRETRLVRAIYERANAEDIGVTFQTNVSA